MQITGANFYSQRPVQIIQKRVLSPKPETPKHNITVRLPPLVKRDSKSEDRSIIHSDSNTTVTSASQFSGSERKSSGMRSSFSSVRNNSQKKIVQPPMRCGSTTVT